MTVRGSLVVHRTGRINGSVSYGEIEIARGGAITGEIKTIAVPSATSSKKEGEGREGRCLTITVGA